MISHLETAIKFYEEQVGKQSAEDCFWTAVAKTTIEDSEKLDIEYLDLLDQKYVGLLVDKYKEMVGIK